YLRIKRDYREVLDIFLALMNRPDYYVEVKFTAAMQALEAYCRRAGFAEPLISPHVYRGVRKHLETSIKAHVPKPLKAVMIKQIRYANRPTLGMQIDRLFMRLDPEVVSAIAPRGAHKFREEIVDARNHLAHQGSGTRPSGELYKSLNGV